MRSAFNIACFIAIPFTLLALGYGLTAPMFLGIGVLFSFSVLFSLVAYHQLHWPSLCLAGGSVAAFFLIFFVPVWVDAARAQTPEDHLRVGEAYSFRGQLFGNNAKTWEHYLIAANGGNAEAQCRVGEAYLFRHYGVPQDREQARHWLTAAARHGQAQAAEMLKNVDDAP